MAIRKFIKSVLRPMVSENVVPSCNVCGHMGGFIDNDPVRPRESFQCPSCRSNSRQRTMALFVGGVLGAWQPMVSWQADKNVRIFESSGFGGYPRYLAEKFTYYNTKFDPDVTSKGGYDNTKYADVQHMSYEDGTFDMVLSSDVLEHVRDYMKALHETRRVLKDGGVLLLQVPYDHNRPETFFRVEVEGDKDIFLSEPYYHAEHYLVYRDYGRDLLTWLKDAGFSAGYINFELPRHKIPRQDMIIAAKSDYLDLSGISRLFEGRR